MNTYTVRRVMAACAVAGSMLMVPAESQAIFHWFGCGGCGTTAYRPVTVGYAPYVAASPVVGTSCCSPCQQTVNYVPQTCYRTVYQQVPVTACQPVATCDPCGNQVTAMRPVVTYQLQARVVPYTTYRPVMAPTVNYAPMAPSCPTGACGTGVTYAAPAPAAGCSTCSTGTATPTFSSPVYTTPSVPSAPSIQQGAPGSTAPSLEPTPDPSNGTTPRTFRDDSGVIESESRLPPIPDTERQSDDSSNRNTNSTLTPRLLDSDRTTYRPLKRAATVIPVAAEEPLQNDGWRAAHR